MTLALETKKAEKIIDILVKENDTFFYNTPRLDGAAYSDDEYNLNDFLALYPESDQEEAIETLIQGEKVSFKGIEFFFIPNRIFFPHSFSLVTAETLDCEELRELRIDLSRSSLLADLVENYKKERNWLPYAVIHVAIAGVNLSEDGFFYTEIDL